MPASFDFGPPPAITHNPAQRLDPTLPRLPKFDPQQVFEQWAQLLKQMTGIDLSSPESLFTSIIGKLQELLGPIFGGINLTGGLTPEQIWAATIANPIKSLTGVDLSSPAALVASIIHLITGGNKFPGVLAISRIANVIQDLLDGAGDFLTAESVTDNPFWDWDSVMPGFISGGSIRANANGTQQVMRSEPFEVFPGQTLELRAAAQWTGASAIAGSNPVKVGFTPFDVAGNPLTDVIRGSLQPSGDHGWQWVPVQDKWPVPAGVKHVAQLLILDSGATAGTFRYSNAASWASNLLDLGAIKDLREMVDAVGGAVNSGVHDIEERLQAITADGKITATEIVGLIQQAQVSGLAIMQTIINQILDILNGNIVTPINSLVQGVKDWFGLNQNKTQALNNSGQMAGSAITGAINEAATGLGALRDAIGAGLGFLGGSMTNQDAQNQAIQVAQIAQQAAAAAAAANAQLAKSQGQQNAGAGGLSYTTTFGGADAASLPAEFSGNNLCIRGANGYAGINSALGDGTYFVTCNKLYATDDQSIAVVLGDQGGSIAAPIYALFQSDSAYTAGVAVRIDYSSVILGSYTRSGNSFTFSPFSGGAWSGSLGQGTLVEVHNVGTSWSVSVGGNVVLSISNSSTTFGPSRRNGGGVVMARATVSLGWFQGTRQYDGFRLAALTLSDYVIPTYAGSGAIMTRTVTTATGSTKGSNQLLPSNFFGNNQASTSDLAVDLSTGKFTVSIAGWYQIVLSFATNSAGFNPPANSSAILSPLLYRNGSVYQTGNSAVMSRINTAAGDSLDSYPVPVLSATFMLYLAVGDYVQGGYCATGGTGSPIAADSGGTQTYMSIALINRSQL
ncbi:hypothetical protein [Mycobacteroides abscessus]|uniref:hypothetical protein n=1 Tax=Mycobacteroides abscessus TaxID=36809 RepID=UPI0009A5DF48|nr:hypothetical protein [Mycobacteroides abscessus]SLC02141.1 Bacteriophage protein [Mycobacteroides abscessus subsp. abscessus]SLG08535.1 Bacteriophage protein [Mycobacteroides abscessus subsp. abscessus]